MNILIFGQFSNNRGDEAAGRAMIYSIKDQCPQAQITVYYLNKKLIPVVADDTVVKNIFKECSGSGTFIISLCAHHFLDRLKMGFLKFNKACTDLIELIRNNDLIILSPGGPYIGDLYIYRNEIIRLLVLFIAQSSKKKTMIYGPSMGPFKIWFKNFARRKVLNKVDCVIVRDKQSKEYLNNLGLSNKNIYEGPDCVFQMRVKSVPEITEKYLYKGCLSSNDKIIGITAINLYWHSIWRKSPELQEKLDIALAQISDYLIAEKGYKVLFIPQLYGDLNEFNHINKVRKRMERYSGSEILDINCDSNIQQMILSKLYFVIGCRHHSVVLATKMFIPAISIAYEFKIESYMRELGLEKYTTSYREVDFNKIKNLCDYIESQYNSYVQILRDRIPKLEANALIYNNEIRNLIGNFQ